MRDSANARLTDFYHSCLFALTVAALCFISETIPNWSLTYELTLLAVVVAALGIPHGALDYRIGSVMLGDLSLFWHLTFLSLYALTALAILLLWSWFPELCLILFLLISVLHFGDSDKIFSGLSLGVALETLTRGLLPVIVPTALHPDQVQPLYALLSTQATADWLIGVANLMLLPTLVLSGTVITWNLKRFLSRRDHTSLTVAIEVLAIVVLFVWLPPLTAFALYFGLLHSVRHLLTVARDFNREPGQSTLKFLTLHALPITSFVLAAALLVFLLMPEGQAFDQRLIQIVFIGLAALTFPHMLLVGMSKWKHRLI